MICHVPQGNPENAHTLSITPSALSGDYDHSGDYDGPCVKTDPTVSVAPAIECQAQLGTNLRFNFYDPIQTSGGSDISAVGTKFLFANVTTGMDAFVEVVNNQNARLLQIDVPSAEESAGGTGLKWAFQRQIQPAIRTTG